MLCSQLLELAYKFQLRQEMYGDEVEMKSIGSMIIATGVEST